MDELLRRDGLQDNSTLPQCTSCLGESGKYRCTDCTTSVFYCASCIVCRHDDIPLHRLEVRPHLLERPFLTIAQVWNGKFFERTSLSDLDYCFYVGHNHTPCPLSDTKPQTILVTDVNGMHHLNVQFCTCTGDPEWVETYRQLLRVGWYPASFQRPKTAFTFDLLDTYHKVALQGKLNLYDFYSSILQKTDNCGRKKVIVSHSFPRIWMFLLTRAVPVSLSRNVTVCSPMAKPETDQTGCRRPHRNELGLCPQWRICSGMPGMSSSGSQPS